MLTKLTVETALIAELIDRLGHEKIKSGSNTRNGYSPEKLLCDDGGIQLNTPRGRENTFEPQLIKKKSDAYRTDGQPNFTSVRQRYDHARNRPNRQGNVRCRRVSHADI